MSINANSQIDGSLNKIFYTSNTKYRVMCDIMLYENRFIRLYPHTNYVNATKHTRSINLKSREMLDLYNANQSSSHLLDDTE